ncbi:MAG TPA: hypothetical protein VIM16_13500 [Mucilaginibacter sp.]|jgi:hypothetical protein
MLNKIPFIIIFLILCAFISNCNDISRREKFDKIKWADLGELGGSEKVLMAEDLIKTKRLIGLTNKQMLQLLGPPANDTTATWYGLEEEGEMLSPDPISGKDLIIKFNKDSVITSAEVHQWHKH